MSNAVLRFKVAPIALASLIVTGGCASAPDPAHGSPQDRSSSVAATDTRSTVSSMPGAPGTGSTGVAGTPSGSAGTPRARDAGATPSLTGAAGSMSGQDGSHPPSATGFVGEHGALRVVDGRIVDAAGEPIQLRGMSLFWSQWSNYYIPNTVDQLADDWDASIVRAALGVENGGYLENPAANEAKVVSIVDQAIARGMYVIVDWHDHHAQDHQAAAIDFFTRMAKKYGDSPNVLFEIFNEPLNVGWPIVKTYAEAVLAAVRGTGAKNIVIVGTPNWSQDVDVAAKDPITTYTDVAYTLHFYAATHKQFLRTKAQQALDAKLPLFVTEWGTCASSGNGALNEAETDTWLDFLTQNQISWINWALNDKAETCSALTPSAGTKGPWSGSALTASGALVKAMIP
jgi:endoglucanase